MPSLADMRQKAQEAGLMKLDKLIKVRQHIPSNTFPIPVKELCERYERLYTGCINDLLFLGSGSGRKIGFAVKYGLIAEERGKLRSFKML